MKKISTRSVLFTGYTLALAALTTMHLGNKIYFLNFYILPILVGAYYFDLTGGVGIAVLSSVLSIVFAHNAGYQLNETSIAVQIIVFSVIGIIAGIFQKENNRLNNYFLQASLTDPLTGLYNYGYFMKRLEEEISRAERYKRVLGLIMIDIDHFKQYNDTYGHEKGNQLLVKLSVLLKETVRHSDIVFRFGGEEFVILLPETGGTSKETAERLRAAVEKEPFPGRGNEAAHITISLGVSYHPFEMKTSYDIVEKADRALYEAKEKGRNRVVIYEQK